MNNISFVAAAWMGMALIASCIFVHSGISGIPFEIFDGIIEGNSLYPHRPFVIEFPATFGCELPTLLTGTKIAPEPPYLSLKPNLHCGSQARSPAPVDEGIRRRPRA
jgi:hypothetical protein